VSDLPPDLADVLDRYPNSARTWYELLDEKGRTTYLDWLARQQGKHRAEALDWLRQMLAALPAIDKFGWRVPPMNLGPH
jgi:hypothetical protein